MADYSDKFQNMVDEMTRFEEEIGLPYIPEMDPRLTRTDISSQPFVIGTNTFSQAQQKIEAQAGPGLEVSFIPSQVGSAALVSSLPNGIPPPPAPPLSLPPAGMRFAPGIPMPYSQPIPPPPQPPSFPNPLMVRQETPAVSSTPTGSTMTMNRRPASTWPIRSPVKTLTPSKIETKPPEESAKVVLSATPKLYTPKVEKVEDVPLGVGTISRLPTLDLSRINDSNTAIKKLKPNEPPKYTPGPSYGIGLDQGDKKKDGKKKKFIRVSGGQTWEDPTLTEWDDGDFRLFCGDLGNDVTDELLTRIFSRYPSFMKAKVVRDKRTNKTKGFGFVSFKDPQDFIKASKEMDGRYVGSRPIKLRKSTWKNRNLDTVKKKEKEKAALIASLTGKS